MNVMQAFALPDSLELVRHELWRAAERLNVNARERSALAKRLAAKAERGKLGRWLVIDKTSNRPLPFTAAVGSWARADYKTIYVSIESAK